MKTFREIDAMSKLEDARVKTRAAGIIEDGGIVQVSNVGEAECAFISTANSSSSKKRLGNQQQQQGKKVKVEGSAVAGANVISTDDKFTGAAGLIDLSYILLSGKSQKTQLAGVPRLGSGSHVFKRMTYI